MIDNLLLGIEAAFTIKNLLYCFYGAVLGTIVGILPGIGPTAALSIVLPYTLMTGDSLSALIMMSSIYMAVMYSGSTSAILTKIPGEITSLITSLDGHPMTKKGKGGAALAISAIGSLIGGLSASILVFLVIEQAANFSIKFGPIELAGLCFLAFASSLFLLKKSLIKSTSMLLLGIFLGSVGLNPTTGVPRFTMDLDFLYNGINFGILAVSLFGLVEILYNILNLKDSNKIRSAKINFKNLLLTKSELARGIPSCLRGTIIGGLLGFVPGLGTILAPILSYAFEKKISRHKDKFGQGMIEGVAGPESANNAAVQTSFVPMLALGIPFSAPAALILATMVTYNILPGPMVVSSHPMLFWGLVVSLITANFLLFVLNYPLVFLWLKFLKLNQKLLYFLILICCIVGVYSINKNIDDIFFVLLPLTAMGYVLKLLDFDLTPVIIGFMIGPFFEKYSMRSLAIHNNDFTIFFTNGISLTCIVISIAIAYFTLRNNAHNIRSIKIGK
jgi:TctA family transporter